MDAETTARNGGDEAVVVVHDLGRDYAGVEALAALDLEVAPGQAVALVGRNGSGKTTALSMVAGRLEPSRGSVHIVGVDVHRRGGAPAVRTAVSFAPDTPSLYTDLTVADHLDLVGMAHGVDDLDTRAAALLEQFGLAERSHLLPRELSHGMRQKTQLACALVRPFSVLLLDEPVAGLDPPSRQTLRTLLEEAKRDGAAIVLSTHNLDFARGLIDHIVVLSDGNVIAAGAYDELGRGARARELGLE